MAYPPVECIDDLDECLVALFTLVALESLGCFHLIDRDRDAPVARPVDDSNKPAEENKGNGIIDLAPDPCLLLEVPADIRFSSDPPQC